MASATAADSTASSAAASAAQTSMSSAEMGAYISAQAYAQNPIVPKKLALAFVIVVLMLLIISSIITALRIYVRAWMSRNTGVWGWEDVFALLGYLAFLFSSVFSIKAAYFGLGTPDSELNSFLMVRASEYMLYAQVLYGVSVPLIKACVVVTLMRITKERVYRWTLYGTLAVATIMAIIGVLASLLYCKPVPAYWNPYLGTCGNFMTVVNIGYAWTATGIVTDWVCAILPWFVIRKLQMTKRTKTVVMIILGCGAIASTASIVRAPYLQYYLASENQLYWNGYIILWCEMESGIGLIAASLPALRMLVVKYLEKSQNSSRGTSGAMYAKQSRGNGRGDVQLDKLSPVGKPVPIVGGGGGGKWERLGDDGSSLGER